eukprot:scaffold329539_cov31-Attheya_sp.AAC.1
MIHTAKGYVEALGKTPEAAKCRSAIYLGDIRQEGGHGFEGIFYHCQSGSGGAFGRLDRLM